MHEAAKARPDELVTTASISMIASGQPEAGEKGGAPALRMGEDRAAGVTPRDRVPQNPRKPREIAAKEALLRAIQHFKSKTEEQAEAMIHTDRFRGIETEDELKDGFIEVIIDYAQGSDYG